eukprot:TRINITY_DN390_c2_g1_i1.p1 TRINITY_DN390_c2_g1~~TRINITY_DN390_c2_g1_i1.p1  ORF type:complete len:1028 (+),score=357.34 TRINITY_DN390_c2_g1_i1:117-3086(+)
MTNGIRSRFTPVVPKNSTLEHRGLVLDNGLTVVLVRNPDEKEIASVALAVARGHMSDPKEVPGMAHFCEHMLFLGNEAYPLEGEYKKYLREHGGGANAYTSAATTCFYFNIVSDYLEGAVDRFLNFFISPLFTEDATLRELNAIESEYHKNLLGDSKRAHYLLKHLSNHEHPFSKFGSGNLLTLLETPKEKGIDTREALKNFYAENYSADIMSLVMRSDRSIDEMEKWVLEGFSKIASNGLKKKVEWEGTRFTEQHLGKMTRYLPINTFSRTMSLSFPYKTIRPVKERSTLIAHLLGHEGKGSLCHYLREKSWITNLVASESIIDNFGNASITFTLTQEGYERVFEVIKEVFTYVAVVRKDVEGMRRVDAERKVLGQLLFDHAPRVSSSRCAMVYAGKLRSCEVNEEFLSSVYLNGEYNEADLEEKLDAVNPRNMLVLLSDPSPADHGEVLVEPWWGVEHVTNDFTEADYTAMKPDTDGAEGRYAVPPPLEYLPDRTDLWDDADAVDRPVELDIGDDQLVSAHWMQRAFNTPMLSLRVGLMSPYIGATPFAQAAPSFITKMMNIDLAVEYYDLVSTHQWSLTFSVRNQQFSLTILGYDDKMGEVANALLKSILTTPLRRATFDMVKEKRIREIEAFKTSRNPLELADLHLSQAMNTKPAPMVEVDKEVYGMTWEGLQAFWEGVKKSMNVQVVAVGNKQKGEAEGIAKDIKATLSTACSYGALAAPHLSSFPIRPRRVCLPDTSSLVEYRVLTHTPNPKNLDSAVVIHYQIGPRTHRTLAHTSVLTKILSPRFFTSLRTQQQLGYLVSVVSTISCKVAGIDFRVQSGVQPPSVLHERIELFLQGVEEELRGFKEEELEEVVRSSIEVYTVPPTNLNQLSDMVGNNVVSGLPWEDDELIVSELRKVTKTSLLDFFHAYVRPPTWTAPSARRVISVYSYSDALAETEMKVLKTQKTRDLHGATATVIDIDPMTPQAWQASMSLYPNICHGSA